MQRLEVSCAVRRIYTTLGAKGLRGSQPASRQSVWRYFLEQPNQLLACSYLSLQGSLSWRWELLDHFMTRMSEVRRAVRELNCEPSPHVLNFEQHYFNSIYTLIYNPDNSQIASLSFHLFGRSVRDLNYRPWRVTQHSRCQQHFAIAAIRRVSDKVCAVWKLTYVVNEGTIPNGIFPRLPIAYILTFYELSTAK